METYLPKFAAIRVERAKGRFFKSEPENHNSEGKGKGKSTESENEERRRREKINGGTFGFYIGYFGEKNCLKEEIYFAVTFSKNPARYIYRNRALLFGVFFKPF